MAHENEHEHDNSRGLAVETAKPEVARPPLCQVLLLNDDFAPMDFVVEVLRGFFNLDQEQAVQIMLHVHTRGRGVCGVFTREVAETKVTHVNEYARASRATSSALASCSASSRRPSAWIVPPSGKATMCFLTFPASSSERMKSVVAFWGISYSPGFRLRALPLSALKRTKPSGLRMTPSRADRKSTRLNS